MGDGSVRRRPFRLRRSCLTVPASSERMLTKARGVAADLVVIDLEDSVVAAEKGAARSLAVDALLADDWVAPSRSVRVNGCSSPWVLDDLITVVGATVGGLATVVVPKVTGASELHFIDGVLRQLELATSTSVGSTGIEVLVEDPRGLLDLRSILAASARLESVILGPGDMAAALGMPGLGIGEIDDRYPGDPWQSVLTTVLVHARLAGVQAVDGPYGRVHDLDGTRRSAQRSRTLGFDGKWVLHPNQVAVANEVYGTTQHDFDQAVHLLAEYARMGAGEQRGAIIVDGEMVDEASRQMALVVAEKGRQQGLIPVKPSSDERPTRKSL